MSQILYTKYNSLRKPEYQITTKIIVDNGSKMVVKLPACEEAKVQINNIKNNYNLLKNYYKKIKAIPFSDYKDGLAFVFVVGEGLLDNIDFVNSDIEVIIEKINETFSVVFDIREENYISFEMTDDFKDMFPDCNPEKGVAALKVSNLDSIFSNFIITNMGVMCIDYEWVIDFPVPINYLKYRVLLYLYNDIVAYLRDDYSFEKFVSLFGIKQNELSLYAKMENGFQALVHGKDRKYRYLDNYKKESIGEDVLFEERRLKEQHISNLENNIQILKNDIKRLQESHKKELEIRDEENNKLKTELHEAILSRDTRILELIDTANDQALHIQRMHKAMKNPFFGASLLAKKIYKKVYTKCISKEKLLEMQEIERIGIYKYKYRDLMAETETDYESWITRKENVYTYPKLKHNPKISVLVPVYNVLDKHLVPCIESVINQNYDNWELCLADDNSTWDNVKETLKKYENNPKIKIVYRGKNGHISECTNSALEVATGEYVGLLDCDDLLSPNALYEVASMLNKNPNLDFIYSDEDKVDDDGNNRHMPHFKPDWSPDTLMSNMYTCHFTVYRKSIIDELGGLRTECNGSQDYDLALRVMDKTTPDRIAHIDKILYHWRERAESTSGNATVKPYVFEAAKKAKLDSLDRRGLKGHVDFVDTMYQYNVVYDVQGTPKVSIVIPSKDNYVILKQCIESVVKNTDYKNYEMILVDNGSNDDNKKKYKQICDKYNVIYIYEKMDFNFSKMCNMGVEKSTGDYILLLNDDIKIPESENRWLNTMLGQAQISYTGAVGAKLLYPEGNKIQHVGVVNIERGPLHVFSGMTDENIYYFGRNRLNYNVLAVTAACLLIDKKKYYEVGGIDEGLAVAYNDVDFCMKLVEAGYFNVVRNDVSLLHYESISRGNDLVDISKTRRLLSEEEKLYDAHKQFSHGDPFYNSNLTQMGNDFSINSDDYKLQISKVSIVDTENLKKIITKEDDLNIEVNIDAISVERYIYIEGWAFIKGAEDNNDIKHEVYLINGDSSYKIDTYKVYRPDLEVIYNTEKNVEFTGFRCRFHRNEVVDGEYKMYVKCGGKTLDIGLSVIK